ncbi:MAG: calmodulin-binding protein [Thermoguttaceae bacterium]
MIRKSLILLFVAAAIYVSFSTSQVSAQQPLGVPWGGTQVEDWNRYYHYPYQYYPQNFQSQQYYKGSSIPTQRYPAEMQVPPYYDKNWQNYYPVPRKYHFGHHFKLDVM